MRALGQAAGSHLHALSWGRDERRVVPHEPDKSIGAEETFARDVDDPEVVRRELLRLSESTAGRLRAAGLAGRTVSVKIRFADFTTITRARTLPEATDVGAVLYATARQLYEALGLDRARLRLVGVRVEGLVESEAAPHQLPSGSGRPAGARPSRPPTGRSAGSARAWSGRAVWSTRRDRKAIPDPPPDQPGRSSTPGVAHRVCRPGFIEPFGAYPSSAHGIVRAVGIV